MSGRPRFSVIVPTHKRRDLVVRLLEGLERQQFREFEAIVVVDGAGEETVSALRARPTDLQVTVIEQPHRGAAAARNTGAAVARGEILLFLDDDMTPDAAMLAEHDRSHTSGADVVLGHIPIHPDAPQTPIAAVIGRWAERRRERLSSADGEVPVSDLISGQLSVARAAFERLEGFDVGFTRGGLVPGADRDFGYRARKGGLRIVFNPAAVSYQHYEVDAAEYTRRTREAGRSDEILAARYPEIAAELWHPRFDTRRARLLLMPLAFAPDSLSKPVWAIAAWCFSRPRAGRRSHRFFFAVQTMERVRGAREGRRAMSSASAVVLAYHAVSTLAHDPILRQYGVPVELFGRQLDRLLHGGWQFVELDRVLGMMREAVPLPKRALLLTFDDAYADLLTAAVPILKAHGLPAVTFVVADCVGRTNEWRRSAATALPLLDAGGLLEIERNGVVIGSHGATHRSLIGLADIDLERELRGSAAQLETLGLERPTVFSYPYGDWDARLAEAVREAGYVAAFTVTPGVVHASSDPFSLPRVEVFADDSPRGLALKLATATWPARRREWVLRLVGVKCRP